MLVNTVSGQTNVTPGVLDHAAVYAYTHGQCAALARALHERTGWPIVIAIYSTSSRADGIHIYTQEPHEDLLDIRGTQTMDLARQRLESQGASEVEFGKGALDALDAFIEHGLIEPGNLDLARTFVDPVVSLAQ